MATASPATEIVSPESKQANHVRVLSVEVLTIVTDDKATKNEAYKRLHAAEREVQEICNQFFQQWLSWHVLNNSAAKAREWLDEVKKWHESPKGTRGKKPVLDVGCFPTVKRKKGKGNEWSLLNNVISPAIENQWPEVHSRIRTLVIQKMQLALSNMKSRAGGLPGWMSVILSRQGFPEFIREMPIQIDGQNCCIMGPSEEGGNYLAAVRVTRVPSESGQKKADSVTDTLVLKASHKARGRRVRNQKTAAELFDRILKNQEEITEITRDNERRRKDAKKYGLNVTNAPIPKRIFRGSMLRYRKSRNKWFLDVCYIPEAKDAPALDASKTAVLRAGRKHSFRLRMPGFYKWLDWGGQGIGRLRRSLANQRRSRQHNYRWAGSSTKGHGRDRAMQAIGRLRQRWKNFVQTYNHQVTIAAVNQCVRAGVGRLVYIQPADDRWFLSTTGKDPRHNDSTGWDWHQVASQLAYKCQREGIEFVVVKSGKKNRKSGGSDEAGSEAA